MAQRQLQDGTRNNIILGIGASYFRDLMVYFDIHIWLMVYNKKKIVAIPYFMPILCIFKSISWNENWCILVRSPLQFVLNCTINSKSALVKKGWHWIGDKPLPELITTKFYNAICCHLAPTALIYSIHTKEVNSFVTATPPDRNYMQIGEGRLKPDMYKRDGLLLLVHTKKVTFLMRDTASDYEKIQISEGRLSTNICMIWIYITLPDDLDMVQLTFR